MSTDLTMLAYTTLLTFALAFPPVIALMLDIAGIPWLRTVAFGVSFAGLWRIAGEIL